MCLLVISYSLPYGDREQNRKGKYKREILKTGVLHKEFRIQSPWEVLELQGQKERTKDVITGVQQIECVCLLACTLV